MKVKMHRILTVVKNILIAKNLNSQHLLAVNQGFLPVEKDRYRLVWSKHCPWAHRIAIAIDLLGLDTVISKGTVDPLRPAGVIADWFFTLDKDEKGPCIGHSLLR